MYTYECVWGGGGCVGVGVCEKCNRTPRGNIVPIVNVERVNLSISEYEIVFTPVIKEGRYM